MLVLSTVAQYYRGLYHFASGGTIDACPIDDAFARVHLSTLVASFSLWRGKHYRAPSYQADLQANLSNVAIPGTGVPLSIFMKNRVLAAFLVAVVIPLVCIVCAVVESGASRAKFDEAYRRHLLAPRHWFSLWQINCRLVALHSAQVASNPELYAQYAMEDKWNFTKAARDHGLPVGRVLEADLVIRHKAVEGGMGIHAFRNVLNGGDFIINERLRNADSIAHLLPASAPLSTLRVMTASRHWLARGEAAPAGAEGAAAGGGRASSSRSSTASSQSADDTSPLRNVEVLSCVFRAGLAGAKTDHRSVLFDVDVATGVIAKATTNAHWYMRGVRKALRCPWTSTHDMVDHPDTGVRITGETISDMTEIRRLVRQAHATLMPDVPVVGWDVAITNVGLVLLEANLSANFFRGSFDEAHYLRFVTDFVRKLEVPPADHAKLL